MALLAQFLAPYAPLKVATGLSLDGPSAQHLLGTDQLGRDLLSRLIYGARVSIWVGFIAVGVGASIGVPIGLISGFYGGFIDGILMRIVDAIIAFPALVLALGMVATFGGGIEVVMIAIGVAIMPQYARIVRVQVLGVRNADYMLAARTVGAGGARILVRSTMNSMLGPNAFRLAAIVFMLSAILFTQSRAAVVALILGIFALAVMLSRGRDLSDGEAAGRRAIVAILVAVLGVSIALSVDPLLNRVEQAGLNDTTRMSLVNSTFRAIQAAPLTGLGFGAYERYYPFFADGTVAGDVDEAHNDVLETISDLGIPAGLAYIAAPVLLMLNCFAGCSRRRRDRVYPAVGFAASVAVGLHAFADFGLQIPAVAVTYAALLGAGVAQSWRTNMDLVR